MPLISIIDAILINHTKKRLLKDLAGYQNEFLNEFKELYAIHENCEKVYEQDYQYYCFFQADITQYRYELHEISEFYEYFPSLHAKPIRKYAVRFMIYKAKSDISIGYFQYFYFSNLRLDDFVLKLFGVNSLCD